MRVNRASYSAFTGTFYCTIFQKCKALSHGILYMMVQFLLTVWTVWKVSLPGKFAFEQRGDSGLAPVKAGPFFINSFQEMLHVLLLADKLVGIVVLTVNPIRVKLPAIDGKNLLC